MTPGVTREILLFLAAQGFIIASGYMMIVMIGEVNRKLPEKEQISYLFSTYAKFSKVLSEYRRFYPGGPLATSFRLCLILGMLCLIAFAWQFGFFG